MCVYGRERCKGTPTAWMRAPTIKENDRPSQRFSKRAKKYNIVISHSKRVWIGLDLWIWNLIFVRFCLWFWRSMNVAMWLIIERTSCPTFGPFFQNRWWWENSLEKNPSSHILALLWNANIYVTSLWCFQSFEKWIFHSRQLKTCWMSIWIVLNQVSTLEVDISLSLHSCASWHNWFRVSG